MADKPTTSRVGRPRSRSASQTPRGAAKVGRPRSKSAQKPKAKGSSKKTATPTERAVRPILQFEQDAVQINPRQFGILWNSTLVCRKTSFHPLLWTSSGLKGTWKLSAYISLVSLRCAKTVINWQKLSLRSKKKC